MIFCLNYVSNYILIFSNADVTHATERHMEQSEQRHKIEGDLMKRSIQGNTVTHPVQETQLSEAEGSRCLEENNSAGC